MTAETLATNLLVWVLACGGLWFGAQPALNAVVKPVLHTMREGILKDVRLYEVVLKLILGVMTFAATFARPEIFDLFAIFNPNIKSVAGLFAYQHWMGVLVTAVPVAVLFGQEIHDQVSPLLQARKVRLQAIKPVKPVKPAVAVMTVQAEAAAEVPNG